MRMPVTGGPHCVHDADIKLDLPGRVEDPLMPSLRVSVRLHNDIPIVG